MFYYNVGCIDFFNGAVPLNLFLKNCSNHNEMSEHYGYHDLNRLKEWIVDTILHMMLSFSHIYIEDTWPSLFIIGLPSASRDNLAFGLIWKQSCNGCTYFASPYEVPDIKKEEERALCDVKPTLTEAELIGIYKAVHKIANNYFDK